MATIYLRRDEAETLRDELADSKVRQALSEAIEQGKPAPKSEACVRMPVKPESVAEGTTVKQVGKRRWEVCDGMMLALHLPWTLAGTIRKLRADGSMLAQAVAKDAKLNGRDN